MTLIIRQNQTDAIIASNPEALASELADSVFAGHGYYAPMPHRVRTLLARAAIREAGLYGIDTLSAIVEFVQAMVDMSPRFPAFQPFRDILTRSDLSAEEKTARILADETAPAWEAVTEHLEDNEDWHLNYWDEAIDWSSLSLRDGEP